MRRRPFIALACVLLGSACSQRNHIITNNGVEVYERYWTAAVQSLSGRTQIELGCTPPDIEYKLITRQGKVPTQVMAEGCGRRALYGRRVRDRDSWTRLDALPTNSAPTISITNTNVQLVEEK